MLLKNLIIECNGYSHIKAIPHRLATEGRLLCLPKSGGCGLRDHEHEYQVSVAADGIA